MGIYLPNMEKMPRKGEMLVIFPDGTSYVCFNGMRERLAQTTAVPVPTPHGRLGDLDELYSKMETYTENGGATGYHDDDIILRDSALFAIELAPTIIPAEEGE